eukprot:TRINITY_DN4136_c0_g1_i2.p1 TRINITY_DN4136_c0_g1~~TRINITY_DN4136_c0_g1_i2.p1  ORF type:complete len:684 (-),score=86.31 TRINITY_DN4136_c0_g1_i2:46-2097(-)
MVDINVDMDSNTQLLCSVVHVVIHNNNNTHLSKHCILQLTLVSKHLSLIVRTFINHNYLFDLSNIERTPLLYQPTKIKLRSGYDEQRFGNNTTITSITFASAITSFDLERKLPDNLSCLLFTAPYTHFLQIPHNITNLTLTKFSIPKVQPLPSITHFTFLGTYLPAAFNKKIPNVTHLTLLCHCDFSTEDLSSNVITHLKFMRFPRSGVDEQPNTKTFPDFAYLTIHNHRLLIPPIKKKECRFSLLSINENESSIQTQRRGVQLDGTYVISQLISAADLFSRLNCKSVLQLALASKTVFKILCPLISENCTFNCFDTIPRISVFYQPKKVTFACPSNLSIGSQHPPSIFRQAFQNMSAHATHLKLCQHFENNLAEKFDLPSTITNLEFGDYRQLVKMELPPNLTHLTFPGFRKQPIDALQLPPRITHLKLSHFYDSPIISLPPNLISLVLQRGFVRPLPNNLLSHNLSLRYLQLGDGFNSPVSILNLPPNLEHLVFGRLFNLAVNELPHKITNLTFGNNYNIEISSLPLSLKHLTMGIRFDRPISNLQRNHNLTHLVLQGGFKHDVSQLPPSLTYLNLGRYVEKDISSLPRGLTRLYLGQRFNGKLKNLPPQLTHLQLGTFFNQFIPSLPPTLVYLEMPDKYLHSFHFLPVSIQHLSIAPEDDRVDWVLENLIELIYCDVKNK